MVTSLGIFECTYFLGELNIFAFEANRLVKNYPNFHLREIDLSLPRGQVLGLVGPNGSGKSTIINILSGLMKPDSGEVFVLGENVGSVTSESYSKIGLVRGEPHFAEDHRVNHLLKSVSHFYDQWNHSYMRQLLDDFEIDIRKKVKELSKGTKLKLSILLALSHSSELLLLDEPFSGLDFVIRKDIVRSLQMIKSTGNTSILICSPTIEEIEKLCDRIALIFNGKIVINENRDTLISSWNQVEFHASKPIAALPTVRKQFQSDSQYIWVFNNSSSKMNEYLTQYEATHVHYSIPSLEEILTILITEAKSSDE